MKAGERRCSIKNCSGIYQSNGLCAKHYQQHLRKTGRLGSRKNTINMGLKNLKTNRGEKLYKRIYSKTDLMRILNNIDGYILQIDERGTKNIDTRFILERIYEYVLDTTR